MTAKNFGKMICMLRNKSGLTQKDLSEKLNISDKAVSKWETGLAFPDITHLPILAELFGVSTDYMLKCNIKGIAIAGSIITDIVNIIDKYPQKNMLANVLSSNKTVGGCVPNVAIDLAKLDSNIYLSVFGKVGNDENGKFLISQLQGFGIDVRGIQISEDKPTSFANVMTECKTGERTFFSAKGANADFGISDIDIDALNCEIFHIGYVCLLDRLDKSDSAYGTVLARLLHSIQEKGIKTSIDAISDDVEGYSGKMIPVLKYCNYVIVNEIESSLVTGLSPRNSDGTLNIKNIKKTMQKFIEYGVKDKVIIHCSEAGFMMTSDGEFIIVPSLELPNEYIKGSVGAGDAYAAGCLYGIYHGYENERILEFASCAAAANLSAVDAVSGMKNIEKVNLLKNQFKRGTLYD